MPSTTPGFGQNLDKTIIENEDIHAAASTLVAGTSIVSQPGTTRESGANETLLRTYESELHRGSTGLNNTA